MNTKANDFPWVTELEKTVIQSLTTSFGLDFLLFHDKEGGDVNTVHNVRSGVYATEQEKNKYENREKYNSDPYHKHENYKKTGSNDKKKQQSEGFRDPYSDSIINRNDKRDLDHVQSAKEIHNDPGRVLAELDGVGLANQNTNLKSTGMSINRSKQDLPIEEFLAMLPERIKSHENKLAKDEARLANMLRETPEQQHNVRKLEATVRKSKSKIEKLKSINPKKMRKADRESRQAYNQQINKAYYSSSKFWGNTATVSGSAGLRMGTRQMLGMIAADIWLELREQFPKIIERIKQNFDFEVFLNEIQKTLKDIWERIKRRFNDFLISFKDGVFAGVFSNLTTTFFNVFATTSRNAIKIIREMWSQLVKAFKLFFFNPDNLSGVDLTKAILAVLSAGVATVIGSLIYSQLIPIFSFPFGAELAAFIGALITGVATLGLSYVLLHSPLMQKLWGFMERSSHLYTLKQFQAINAHLDEYLKELAYIELNLEADELEQFALELSSCNSEIERSFLLKQDVEKREINLPFEMCDPNSTRQWLSALAKKP